SGKEIQDLPTGKGIDDLTFDPRSKCLYPPRGAEASTVYVYQEDSPHNHEPLGEGTSEPRARNSRYAVSLRQLYASAHAQQAAPAEILVYQDK
ncbi:MAG: hypothetical protein WBE47_13925, partial [Candidatus Acidiferrales bacterium]